MPLPIQPVVQKGSQTTGCKGIGDSSKARGLRGVKGSYSATLRTDLGSEKVPGREYNLEATGFNYVATLSVSTVPEHEPLGRVGSMDDMT